MRISRCILGAVALVGFASAAPASEDWLPVSPDELQSKSVDEAPGASAVYLYRQVDRDDINASEASYLRIKILTPEGRKYGNVEIAFIKDLESIRNIQARTICPNGTVARFDGTVYETQIVSARQGKLLAKTFTLPGVEPGCIVEYRFSRSYRSYNWVYDSHWTLNADLYTKTGKFSLQANRDLSMRWAWPNGLPPGTEKPRLEKGTVRLEVHNVAAFVTEDHMPPESQLQLRVDFMYENDPDLDRDPKTYWQKYGKATYGAVERFVDKGKVMQEAVAQTVLPSDSPEVKLRKIYARTQRMRNLSYEREQSEAELEREGRHDAHNVADIWKANAGTGIQITWVFMALCRAAGLSADGVMISTRDVYRFDARIMNPQQLNSNVVIVSIGGKDVFLDPGTPYTPFGLLPWNETDTPGLRLNKDGGVWITTPVPSASDARLERRATLTLENGQLQGRLIVSFTGLEAAAWRVRERLSDASDRREALEHKIEAWVPSGIEVKLTNSPDWDSSDGPLVAEYDLKIPGWVTGAGRRQLLPVGLFGDAERHTFEHVERVQPIYFDYPCRYVDDITIAVPEGWRVENPPQPQNIDLTGVVFSSSATSDPPVLHLTRELTRNFYYTTTKSYPALHSFYQRVRTSDEQQIVLSPGPAANP